eukprot:1313830-Rhodomonas_salina.2
MEVRIRDNDSTNGTYLLRSSPPSFLPPQHPTDASTGAPQSDSGQLAASLAGMAPVLAGREHGCVWLVNASARGGGCVELCVGLLAG